MEDLDWGGRYIRSLSQTPVEEIDETSFKTDCANFWVVLCMQIKKQFPLEGVVARLRILDSVEGQDLTKNPSSIANMALCFPNLVHEDQLEAISVVVV